MKVKWYGHASFRITSEKGLIVITGPYEPGAVAGAIAYGRIPDVADIVLVSHDHGDRNYVQGLPGSPKIVKGSGSHRVIDLARPLENEARNLFAEWPLNKSKDLFRLRGGS